MFCKLVMTNAGLFILNFEILVIYFQIDVLSFSHINHKFFLKKKLISPN